MCSHTLCLILGMIYSQYGMFYLQYGTFYLQYGMFDLGTFYLI